MEKPWLVVMGNKGVGKSYLLEKIFGDLDRSPQEQIFENNESSSHVTVDQYPYPTPNHSQFSGCVDTVGIDSRSGNILGMRDLYGKPLLLLYLNNDLRVGTSLDRICQMIGADLTPEQIWAFNSHSFKGSPADRKMDQYEDIWIKLVDKPISSSKIVRVPPPPTPKPKPEPQLQTPQLPAAPLLPIAEPGSSMIPATTEFKINKMTKKEKKQKNDREFAKDFPRLQKREILDHLHFRLQEIDICKEFEKLGKQGIEEVKKHRQAGDGLFKMMTERMVYLSIIDAPTAEQIRSNETMKSFFVEEMGDAEEAARLVCKVYGEEPTAKIGAEKYADLVEALFHKTFNLHVLHSLVDHFYANEER